MYDGIKELTGAQEVRPGGHNWPDMQIVIDPSQTEIEDNGIYLVQIKDRDPVVKRCVNRGSTEVYLHPALSTVHGQTTVELFGRKVPCQSIEFSDNIYKRYITVHGRVVGIWAGPPQT
jgi:hypothetical protein